MPLAEYVFYTTLGVAGASAGVYALARVVCAAVDQVRYWVAQLTDPLDTGE